MLNNLERAERQRSKNEPGTATQRPPPVIGSSAKNQPIKIALLSRERSTVITITGIGKAPLPEKIKK